MDLSHMNGLEIASAAAQAVEQFAPLIAKGIQLGLQIDPVLGRQLQAAHELAVLAFKDADERHEKALKDAEKRIADLNDLPLLIDDTDEPTSK